MMYSSPSRTARVRRFARIPDAEVDLALQDLGKKERLLLVGAELHDRGAHGVDGQHGDGSTRPHRLVEEDELLDRRPALAAPLRGPSDPEPPVGAHLPHDPAHRLPDATAVRELLDDVRRQQVGVVGAQLLAQLFLLLGVTDVHFSHPTGPADSR
jgi:hypothetical protein